MRQAARSSISKRGVWLARIARSLSAAARGERSRRARDEVSGAEEVAQDGACPRGRTGRSPSRRRLRMVRTGGFSLSIHMRGRDLDETKIDGHTYMQAEPGSSFAVVVGNNNGATYAVRLFVDGKEAEPGYIKKIRPNEDTVFKGWICEGKDVLEFLFARTPIEDDDARAASSSSSPSSLGEVRALIYATRRVRVESSSSESDDDDDRRRDGRRRSSASLGTTALPEKAAIKELGVQCAPAPVDRCQIIDGGGAAIIASRRSSPSARRSCCGIATRLVCTARSSERELDSEYARAAAAAANDEHDDHGGQAGAAGRGDQVVAERGASSLLAAAARWWWCAADGSTSARRDGAWARWQAAKKGRSRRGGGGCRVVGLGLAIKCRPHCVPSCGRGGPTLLSAMHARSVSLS